MMKATSQVGADELPPDLQRLVRQLHRREAVTRIVNAMRKATPAQWTALASVVSHLARHRQRWRPVLLASFGARVRLRSVDEQIPLALELVKERLAELQEHVWQGRPADAKRLLKQLRGNLVVVDPAFARLRATDAALAFLSKKRIRARRALAWILLRTAACTGTGKAKPPLLPADIDTECLDDEEKRLDLARGR